MAEDSEEYLVERIIEYRIRKGVKQYFVKWKGFSDDDNTWEPIENLEQIKNGMEMVKEFHASSGLKPNTTAKEDAVEEPKAGPSGVKRKPPPSSSSDSSSSDSGSSSEDDKPKTKVKMSLMKNGGSKKKISKSSKKARVASSSSSSDSDSEEENRRREKKAIAKKDNPTTRSKKPEPDEDKENIHVKTKSARPEAEPEVDLSEASTSEEDEAQMIQKELASVLPPSVKIPTTTVVNSPAVQSAFRTIAEEASPSPPDSGKLSPAATETHSSRGKAAKTGEEEASASSTMASVKYESLPSYPKRPFEDGYKVKEILHVTIINKQVIFLCRFEDLPHGLLDTVELCVLRYTQPELVIKFFQERVRLVTLDKDGKAVLDNASKLNGIAKESTSSKPATPGKKEDTNKEQKSQKKKPKDDKAKLTSLGLDVSSDSEDENISTFKSASSTIDKDKGKSRPESSSKKKDHKKKEEPKKEDQKKKEDQRKKIAALGLEDSDDDDDLEIEEKVGTKSKPDKKVIEKKKKKKDKKVNDILDSLGLEASDSD